jgi:hypothetical protein
MKTVLLLFVVPILLSGCKSIQKTSPGRYTLLNPVSQQVFEVKPTEQERKDVLAVLRQMKAHFEILDDVKRNKGRCVLDEQNKQDLCLEIIFDERDWEKNIKLKVRAPYSPGYEQVSPEWTVLDTKSNRAHLWFYGSLCPISNKRMWEILSGIYSLQ